jgi:DNA topoisomerase VI subunit A
MLLNATLGVIGGQTTVADQREVYYRIRMDHPDWQYRDTPISSKKVYDIFVDRIMEEVQLATGVTIQGLGIRPGPRGTVFGDGDLSTPRRGFIPLKAKPTLNFDLVDEGVQIYGHMRKHINYEKLAGFDALVEGDIATMVEASFSTSQGYMSEAASKFMADQERRGLRLYVLGDGDPHGGQIEMMYGRSSKNSAYMPDVFYPKSTKLLGLFPSIASALELPPESVKESHQSIFDNLRRLAEENPDYEDELKIIINRLEQWEWQALAGLTSDPYQAYQTYLVEALRAVEDEIKYVPPADDVKSSIIDGLKAAEESFIRTQVEQFATDALAKAKQQIVDAVNEALKSEIEEFENDFNEELGKLEDMDADDFREAVKQRLCENPAQYADGVISGMAYDLLSERFEISAKVQAQPTVSEVSVEKSVTVDEPDVPEEPLTKNDICDAIESRILSDRQARQGLVEKMRRAIQEKLGIPDVTW